MEGVTETSLRITRHLNATPQRVWKALANEDQLKQWFCPGTRRCEVTQWDFREGGEFRVTFAPTEDDGFGGPSPAFGRFERLKPNDEVHMTWNWDFPDPDQQMPESRITMRLTPKGEETEFEFIHEGLPNKEAVEGHFGGWASTVPKLDDVLLGS